MNFLKHIFLFFAFIIYNLYASTNEYKVGIYNNPPKIYLDATQTPRGIYAAILEHVAQHEGIKFVYVGCDWNDCFELLQKGELDILPDVAHTPKREEFVAFSKVPVLSSWSVLYKNKKSNINSILDLDSKKVAVLRNSIQLDAIKNYTKNFLVEPIFREVASFDEAFLLAKTEHLDAILTNRFYLNLSIDSSKFEKTDILLEPSMLKFAFNKSNQNLLSIIDTHLQEMKENKNSPYNQELVKLLESTQPTSVPKWVYPTFLSFF